MIVFDLRCSGGHVFEAWFASSAAYAEQRDKAQVECPLCGDRMIEKAVMAPQIAAKGNTKPDMPNPQAMKAALEHLAQAQAKMLEKSTWVGSAFAEKARAMHEGEAPVTPIHGQASLAEAKALVEEGVPVAPLPLPVVPPKLAN
ncbi:MULTISPECIES: DUF1178 family protein [Sphingomonas]|jgi:hypothetical protein|uniref:DUF1178 family protein n=1 Tax=Sphingomonas zeae TaxID=1646122 RepID=A0A7Y6B8J7_9SPHN|nr:MULTISPECIES: DUF1178 family protein [Sphingomonas]MBB4047082.1 hypothetical protein [Sphingomonas zeae]MDK8186880.1 DUF1178 family protein [Sphingomonas zeae]MDK8214129.1 DUF1178 family protein [Sphingomonas sp. UMB7805-LC452B]NUU49188.1 DUF1178 family protein [Sphingomonas zeae]